LADSEMSDVRASHLSFPFPYFPATIQSSSICFAVGRLLSIYYFCS